MTKSPDEGRGGNPLPGLPQTAQQQQALAALQRGWAVTPLQPGSRAAVHDWTLVETTAENLLQRVGPTNNWGLILGRRSGGLVDVDLDCDLSLKYWQKYLPKTEMISGRDTRPSSHLFYISNLCEVEQTDKLNYLSPLAEKKGERGTYPMLLQLRIGGGDSSEQTVGPGSVYPDGDIAHWYDPNGQVVTEPGEPARAEGDQLKRAVKLLATMIAVSENWPTEGMRHEAALVIDGFLLVCGLSEDERRMVIEDAATEARDDEIKDRVLVTARTDERRAKKKKLPGRPRAVEVFGEGLVNRLWEWWRPTEVEQQNYINRMNAEYAVIQYAGRTLVLRFDKQHQRRRDKVVHTRSVATYLTFTDLRNYHLDEYVPTERGPKPLGHFWLTHRERRKYEGLTFRPDCSEESVDGRLNLWRGFGVAPAPGDWSLMQTHIVEVLACGDEQALAYFLDWLGWSVQNPADRAEVALVLQGGRGTGKGTLGNAMCRIFGQHATHISSVTHLAGRFNAHLQDVCLLFADEAYWPGDKSAEGTLKRLITEPTLFIEAKGRDGVTTPNMLHVIMASNDDWVVPAGEHERRYAVFQVSEVKRQDRDWFGPLYEQLENGGYAAMLYDLLHRDLGEFHPRQIPITEALRRQQEYSIPPADAWVLKLFETGQLPDPPPGETLPPNVAISQSKADMDGRNPRNGLYDLAREQPRLRHFDHQVLARHLKDWGCTAWRSENYRGWKFPPLSECRMKWAENYPGWQWDHPDLTEWYREPSSFGQRPKYDEF